MRSGLGGRFTSGDGYAMLSRQLVQARVNGLDKIGSKSEGKASVTSAAVGMPAIAAISLKTSG